MKQFTLESEEVKRHSAFQLSSNNRNQDDYSAYIGLDVHKETIAIAVASRERGKVIYHNEIPNRPKSLKKRVDKLNK